MNEPTQIQLDEILARPGPMSPTLEAVVKFVTAMCECAIASANGNYLERDINRLRAEVVAEFIFRMEQIEVRGEG